MNGSPSPDRPEPAAAPRPDFAYAADGGHASVGYGDSPAQRTFREYLLIVRERIWYLLAVFLALVGGEKLLRSNSPPAA